MKKIWKTLILGPLAFLAVYFLARVGVSYIPVSAIDLDIIFICALFLAVLFPIFVYIIDLEGEKSLLANFWVLAVAVFGLIFWPLNIEIMGSFTAKNALGFSILYMVIFTTAFIFSYFKQPTRKLPAKQVTIYSAVHFFSIFSAIALFEFLVF